MAEDDSEKTEEPTGRRLGKAREEGQVAQSPEIKLWAGLIGVLIIVALVTPHTGRSLVDAMLPFIDHPHAITVDAETLGVVLTETLKRFLMILLMPLAIMLALGVAANISQVGLMWVTKGLMPDLNRFSPLNAVKRVVSSKNLVDFAKSMAKIGIIGTIIYFVLKARVDDFVALAAVDIFAMLAYLKHETVRMVFVVLMIVTALAAADWFYQRWSFMQKMRMTKQEVKDEHKQTEGDPMIKSRLRSLRMQRARQRMMAAVPKATVVVTNPTHYAVALKYEMDSPGAPVLVAKGADLVAKRIRELAGEHDVPVVENPPLARGLYASVELDQEIPPEHYKAVAEVISYVMKLRGRFGKK